jgi:hypothetical protein
VTPGEASDVFVVGGILYVADLASGLQIFDVSTPAAPSLLGSVDTPGESRSVVVSGATAYVADSAGGLQIIDVSNPASPTIVGAYTGASDSVFDVAVSGSYAYLAALSAGVLAIDVSDPTSPTLAGAFSPAGNVRIQSVQAVGSTVYAADNVPADFVGLRILQVSEVTEPTPDPTPTPGGTEAAGSGEATTPGLPATGIGPDTGVSLWWLGAILIAAIVGAGFFLRRSRGLPR